MKELLTGNQGTMGHGACCTTERMLVRSESMDIVIKRMSVHVDDKEKPQEQLASGSNLSGRNEMAESTRSMLHIHNYCGMGTIRQADH